MHCGITDSGQHSPKGFLCRGIGRCLLIVAAVVPWGAAVVTPAIIMPEIAVAQEEDAAVDGATEPQSESKLVFYYKAARACGMSSSFCCFRRCS